MPIIDVNYIKKEMTKVHNEAETISSDELLHRLVRITLHAGTIAGLRVKVNIECGGKK